MNRLHSMTAAGVETRYRGSPIAPAAALGFAVLMFGVARPCSGDVLPRAAREAQNRLLLAREAVADGRFSHAVLLLEDLLGSEEDGFVAPDGPDGPQRTLKAEAAAVLASFPPGELAHWETWCGEKARRLLARAVAERDRDGVARVAVEFPGTLAAAEAALILGYDALDRREPLEALGWLGRLGAARPATDRLSLEATLAAAVAQRMAGRADRAAEALGRLAAFGPGVVFRLGDEQFTTGDDPQAMMIALESAVGPGLRAADQPADGWRMVRGDAARRGAAEWSGRPGALGWKVDVAEGTPPDAAGAALAHNRFRAGPLLPAAQPLLVGSLVLARTPRRLVAIDQATGRQIWEFPWGGDAGIDASAQPIGGAIRLSAVQGGATLAQRAYEDAAYGQMASDGRRVFLIDGLTFASRYATPIIVMVAGQRTIQQAQPATHNRLVALDLKREGMLAWSVGAESGEDEAALAGAFFLGPPLVDAGRLYVLAEMAGEIRLVVLDAAAGRLAWSLGLATPEHPIHSDPPRRLAGATPSMADGVLVCTTSAGALVAVDPATRSILWGYQYPVNQESARAMRLRMVVPGGGADAGPVTSVDATATIAGGRVLLAPVESNEIVCLDLYRGDLLWRRPLDDLLYVGCVVDETVMVVGHRSLSAWRLPSGLPAWGEWTVDLPEGARTSGRGVAVGRHFFVPTTTRELLRIDAATGRIDERSPIDAAAGTPGNLAAFGSLLVSQSAEAVAAFGEPPEQAAPEEGGTR